MSKYRIVAEHHHPEFRGDHAIDAVTPHEVAATETVEALAQRLVVGEARYGQAWIVLRRLEPTTAAEGSPEPTDA